ncbi:MAG: hypothetical protein H0V79_03585 [Actinobacteria bacterium]|nr:hypothetical protein [Actinomycetota bacterium]
MTIGKRDIVPALSVLGALVALGGCGGDGNSTKQANDPATVKSALPQGSEPVELDPKEFTIEIDNPYWPMRPGNKWVYRETDTKGALGAR